MGLKELAVGKRDVFYVDPRELSVKEGFNSRVADDPANKEHIEFLARSIAEVGVKEPLTVFNEDGKIYISDGHCRLAATLIAIKRGAEIVSVPVKSEDRGTSEADRLLRQVLESKNKTPLEQGVVYKRLIGHGWPIAMIAQKAGKSVSQVNAALDLQEAPAEAKQLVASGKVSATLAGDVIRKSGATEGTKKLKAAVAKAESAGKKKATSRHVEKTTPAQKSLGRDPEAIERLIKHLVRAARAGDEKLVKWLAEADISID